MAILIVEDDEPLRLGLRELLTRQGYNVREADSVRSARAAMDDSISLVVLDVSLPDGDGVTLCQRWREQGIQTPILFLTARSEEMDVVRGLDAGGSDYVSKPFRMQELLSRIRSQLRRQGDTGLIRGGIRLYPELFQASRDGNLLSLTLTEYKILQLLMRSTGIVTRQALLDTLWDVDARFVDDNTLSVHVSRLRDKIGPEHIKTVRGVGYQWRDG